MKNKSKYIYRISIFVCFLFLLNCDDYLSELPDNRTPIDNKEKISSLITRAYSNANYMLMAELMSDNADDKENTDATKKLDLQMYSWQDSNLEGQDTPTYYWNDCYRTIAQANQALESIKELESQYDLKTQKGEALLCRAYAHFMLVNFWSEAYNPNTANTDLGVPYVLTPEKVFIKGYKRNTVKQVYDSIEKDLLEGLSLVDDRSYEHPKFHFTKAAGYAFATRFYLHKGEWDQVIKYASMVLTDNPADEIRDMNAFRSMTYSEAVRSYSSPLEPTNLLITSNKTNWTSQFAYSRFGLSVSVANNLFGAGNPFNKQWAYNVNGANDFYYNFSKFIGQNQINLFTKDEVLLNRAEAYAMNKDYTNSLKDLTAFLSKKTQVYDMKKDILTQEKIANNEEYAVKDGEFTPFYPLEKGKQATFIKAIAEFKRREFCQEGLRWFDVKRFHIEVTHKLKDSPDMVLKKDDPRRVLQIPLTAQNILVPNKR